MRFLELANDAQFNAMTELMASVEHADDPRDVLSGLLANIPGDGRSLAFAEITTLDHSAGAYTIRRLCCEGGEDIVNTVRHNGSPQSHGGFIEKIIRTPLPKIARELDLSADPVLPQRMSEYRSAMAVPVFVAQSANDWLVLFDRRADAFSNRELSQMLLRASLVGTMISNMQMARRLFDANVRVQMEIENIAAIQARFCRKTCRRFRGCGFRPATRRPHRPAAISTISSR